MEKVRHRSVQRELSPFPQFVRQRSKSFQCDGQRSSPLISRRDLQVQLLKQSPRSLNGSVTSLSSAELTLGGSPRPVRSGIQKLFARNKDQHGSQSGKEESESEDSDVRTRLYVPPERPKHFLNVLAQIREHAMPSSLSRGRSKTQESQSADFRSSSDVESGGRPRGGTVTGGSSGGISDQPPRGRSATGLSSNDEDSVDLDVLDGALSSQEKDSIEDVDGPVDSEKVRHAVDHLNRKIRKTREQIRQLQEERDEYVKEYLESTEGSHKTKAVKTHFEKKNQKTNAVVLQLQKKLEKYHNTLVELELNGAAPSGHIAKEVLKGVKENIRGISGGVRDGVKGAVTKPLEIIKNRRFGSAENVSTTTSSPGSRIDGFDEDPSIPIGEESFALESNLSSARYISDDDSSSIASATHMISIPVPGSSPRHSLPPSPPTCYEQDISDLRDANTGLQEQIVDLKRKLDLVAESLQEERFKSEQLRYQLNDITNQWNDMTELHQNEMMSLKQELERAEERIELVEYRSAERASEIEEALDTHVTRVMKIEALQQQNQQMTTKLDDYLDHSFQAKALLSKFLTMMLAILQIILIICTTLTRMVLPFTRTRCRIVLTSIAILIVLVLWKYQESDSVRVIKSRMTEQYALLRNKLEALGVPLQVL